MKKIDKPGGESAVFGSFLERGLKNVAMQSGTNVRIFNEVNLHAHGYIEFTKIPDISTWNPASIASTGGL